MHKYRYVYRVLLNQHVYVLPEGGTVRWMKWSEWAFYRCWFECSEKNISSRKYSKTSKKHTFTKERMAIKEMYAFIFFFRYVCCCFFLRTRKCASTYSAEVSYLRTKHDHITYLCNDLLLYTFYRKQSKINPGEVKSEESKTSIRNVWKNKFECFKNAMRLIYLDFLLVQFVWRKIQNAAKIFKETIVSRGFW